MHADLFDLSAVDGELGGYDACFFCLGVSAAGMSEADYRRVTYDLTLAVAERLACKNPQMTFIYVSGSGTDASEKGRAIATPLIPLLSLLPSVTTTEKVGRAMIVAARGGAAQRILENSEINRLSARE